MKIIWKLDKSCSIYRLQQNFPLLGEVVGDIYFDGKWCLELECNENNSIIFDDKYDIDSLAEAKLLSKQKIYTALEALTSNYENEIRSARSILQSLKKR